MDGGMHRMRRQKRRRNRGGARSRQPRRVRYGHATRRGSLQPKPMSTRPTSAPTGGEPVRASWLALGVAVGVGAGVGTGVGVGGGGGDAAGAGAGAAAAAGQVDGIAPAVCFPGRYFEASAVSACVVDNASGAAVAAEPGLENPKPPLSNWNVSKSLSADVPATVKAAPAGSSPMASRAWMTAASELGSESGEPAAYAKPPLAFCCVFK